MPTLEELKVVITGDASGLTRTMRDASQQAERFENNSRQIFNRLDNGFTTSASNIENIGAAVTASLAGLGSSSTTIGTTIGTSFSGAFGTLGTTSVAAGSTASDAMGDLSANADNTTESIQSINERIGQLADMSGEISASLSNIGRRIEQVAQNISATISSVKADLAQIAQGDVLRESLREAEDELERVKLEWESLSFMLNKNPNNEKMLIAFIEKQREFEKIGKKVNQIKDELKIYNKELSKSITGHEQSAVAIHGTVEVLNDNEDALDRVNNSIRNNISTNERYESSLRNVNNTLERTGSAAHTASSSMGRSVSNMAGMLKAGLASAAVVTSIKFIGSCLKMSSALTEVQNVVDVTYGEMSRAINDFAENAQDRFGMAELSAKQFAGTMGSILKSLGLSTEQAALMSMNITQLAGDLASFYNIDQEDAFEKIRGAVGSGETEAIKSLGINMSVASLNAYAMAQGLGVAYDKMDASQQAILRYNYLLSVTGAQQNDYARTTESWANQTRTLSQEWDRFKSIVGSFFETVLRPMLAVLNKILGKFNDILGITAKTEDTTSDMSSITDNVSDAFANTAQSANDTASGIKKSTQAAKALKNALMGFDEINRLDNKSATGSGALSDLDKAAQAAKNLSQNINDAYGYTNELNKVFDSTDGEMSKHFGGVALNMEQIKAVAGRIVSDKDLEKIAELTKKINSLDALAENINQAGNAISSYNWMVSIGMKLTEEDKEKYLAAVSSFVDNSNKYLQEKKEMLKLACEIVFGEGSEEELNIDKLYGKTQAQMAELGEKLKKRVNDAWEDGVITLDEAKEIENIKNQMAKILNVLSESEINVSMQEIKVKFNGADLTEESFDELTKEIDKRLEEYNKGQDEAQHQLLVDLQAQLLLGNITQEEYDKEYDKIIKQVEENKTRHANEAIAFKVNTAIQMLGNDKDIEKALKSTSDKIQKYVDGNMPEIKFNATSSTYWNDFLTSMNTQLSSEITKLTPDQKKIVKKILDNLEPQEKELNALAKKYAESGERMPEAISEGLTKINLLKAMTGDVDAMYYLIGNQMSDSKDFKEAVETAQKSGIKLPDSLIKGLSSKKADLTKGVDTALGDMEAVFDKNTTVGKAANKTGQKAAEETKNGLIGSTSKSVLEKGTSEFLTWLEKGLNPNTNNTNLQKDGQGAFNKYNGGFLTDLNKRTIFNSGVTIATSGKSGAGSVNYEGTGKSNAGEYNKGLGDSGKKTDAQKKGKDLANSGKKGADSVDLTKTGKDSADDYNKGLGDKKKKDNVTTTGKGIAGCASAGIKTGLALSAVGSGLFYKYGVYTVDGYNKGVNDNKDTTTKDGGVISKWVGGIGSYFMKLMGIHSPSRLFKSFGGYTVEGYNIGIEDNMDTTEDILEDWADIMNGFCDDIDLGSIDVPQVRTSLPVTELSDVVGGGSYGQSAAMNDNRPVNITLKVGQTAFAKVTADSLNKLIRQEGEMVLDMSYL